MLLSGRWGIGRLCTSGTRRYEAGQTEKHQAPVRILYADMVIVSNSTVYAFNDFGTINSALIRDLMNFHVACVQHGMSIQKIAVAQNRLRDNTRLYFCASKYEIEICRSRSTAMRVMMH